MSGRTMTRVTFEFDVYDDDVQEVAGNMLEHPSEQVGTNLSHFLQSLLYDSGDGPQLEGEYRLVAVKDITK